MTLNLPDGVKLTPEPEKSIGGMLASGELDAAFSAHAPDLYRENHPKIRRLFEDYQSAEQEYYEQTKVFPIMHVIAVRKEILDKDPWVAGNLFTAFKTALDRSIERLEEITASRVPLPWATLGIPRLAGANWRMPSPSWSNIPGGTWPLLTMGI